MSNYFSFHNWKHISDPKCLVSFLQMQRLREAVVFWMSKTQQKITKHWKTRTHIPVKEKNKTPETEPKETQIFELANKIF